jgi:biotin carboxyl carrier protein
MNFYAKSMKVIVDGQELDVFIASVDGKGTLEGKKFDLDIEREDGLFYHLEKNGKIYNVQVLPGDDEKKPKIRVNGLSYDAELIDKYDELVKRLGMEKFTKVEIKELKSPMPGLVMKLDVKVGDVIEKGHPIMILEAMKMENVIKSRGEGKIAKIHIKEGQAVEKNELLISFE